MPSIETSEYLPYLELRVPRCAVCSTEWCGRKSDRDSNCDKKCTNDLKQVFGELLLLPQCGCTHLKIVSCAPLRAEDYNVFFHEFQESLDGQLSCQLNEKDAISDILNHIFPKFSSYLVLSSIQTLSHNAMCKPCLERFLKASEQVEKQVATETPFSTSLNCPTCRRRYTSRELSSLLKEPSRITPVFLSSSKHISKTRDLVSFDKYVQSTIQTIMFWKDVKRIVHRTRRKQKHTHAFTHSASWTPLLSEYAHSSDSCFSSNEEDDDDEDATSLPCRHHVELNPGELQQELMKKDFKYRQEVENQKCVLSMQLSELFGSTSDKDMDYAKYLEVQAETETKIQLQLQEDHALAEKLQQEVDGLAQTLKLGEKRNSRVTSTCSKDMKNKKRRMSDSDVITSTDDSTLKKKTSRKNYTQSKLPVSSSENREKVMIDKDIDPSVKLLVDMGFPLNACESTLRDAKYNVDLAISMLLSEQAVKEIAEKE